MEEHKKMALLGSAPINRSLLALGVPTMTDLFHRLRAMGADVDPSVYTVEQAKAAILNALARKGSTPASSDGRGAV